MTAQPPPDFNSSGHMPLELPPTLSCPPLNAALKSVLLCPAYTVFPRQVEVSHSCGVTCYRLTAAPFSGEPALDSREPAGPEMLGSLFYPQGQPTGTGWLTEGTQSLLMAALCDIF